MFSCRQKRFLHLFAFVCARVRFFILRLTFCFFLHFRAKNYSRHAYIYWLKEGENKQKKKSAEHRQLKAFYVWLLNNKLTVVCRKFALPLLGFTLLVFCLFSRCFANFDWWTMMDFKHHHQLDVIEFAPANFWFIEWGEDSSCGCPKRKPMTSVFS